jgi:polyhydroxybutyrate depolymerase
MRTLAALVFALIAALPARAAVVEHFLEHDGAKRRYIVYLPSGYDRASGPRAALINFHGGGGHAEQHARSSAMNAVADRHGFIVVYPDGSSGGGRLLTWNAGTCCGYAARRKVDDVGFVRKLIAQLERDYPVDPARVFVAGHSNGGMFAYRFAAEASELVAGAGIVAADLAVDGPAPKRPVPLVVFHGLKDRNVLWEGGKGPNQFDPSPHRSIPETLRLWKQWNHCEAMPARRETAADFVMERYEPAPGRAGAPIVLYKLPEGGHSWPGGEPGAPFLNLGPHVKTVDASELMWRFFASLGRPAEQQ